MIPNYFKTLWRNLSKQLTSTIIMITGLAIGTAACLLIFLVISFETSFDQFHQKKDRTYRIVTTTKANGAITHTAGLPLPFARTIRAEYPDLTDMASILMYSGQITVPSQGTRPVQKFEEHDVYFTEHQFFNIFDFAWLAGDKKTALTAPNTVVLSQEYAEKYFGSWENAIGKTIIWENKLLLKVTGVLKRLPINTDLPVQIAISFETATQTDLISGWNNYLDYYGKHFCFVALPENLTPKQFEHDLDLFIKKYKPTQVGKIKMSLQPLKAMHYDTNVRIFSNYAFTKDLIKALALIGIFLIIIACVNFINLATAQAAKRAKEIGIRKVLGSNRKQLLVQFIGEAFIVTFFASLVALVLAMAGLPFLNEITSLKLDKQYLFDPHTLIFLGGLIVCVTFLAGAYPAYVLSGFKPVYALKQKLSHQKKSNILFRRGLVTFQFAIAQVLMIGTLVVVQQMYYVRNKSLGYNKDNVLNLPIPDDSLSRIKLNSLRNQLLQLRDVKEVSYSFTSPSDNINAGTYIRYDNSTQKTDFYVSLKYADTTYFKLYDLKFVAGRPYSDNDSLHEYVVNETLLKKLGVSDPQKAIGKYISLGDSKTRSPIVGVVKDFNTRSLHEEIQPIIMTANADYFLLVNLKIQPGNASSVMPSIEKIWTNTFPTSVFYYQFLSEKIEDFYKADNTLSELYKVFTCIAIFISCLGLYGLVSFMAVQRYKEIGIRKTLGASVSHIVYLFLKELTSLILLASVVSAPVAWVFMNRWLQNFTYKINISAHVVLLTILGSVLIAWLTVIYTAMKAALVNPIKSLRSE